MMRAFLRSTFLWQFVAGFALGALGMVTLAPASMVTSPVPNAMPAGR